MRLFRKNNENKKEEDGETAVLSTPLAPGTPAPEFTLDSNTGQPISLSDFRGQAVILAFYPADNSPVCSSQLALYNEVQPLFKEHNARLLAISTDSANSHQTFAQNLSLSFPLLADNDPAGAVARSFNVYDETHQICERALFVIDGEGTIHWSHVSPKGVNPGANGILNALESLE